MKIEYKKDGIQIGKEFFSLENITKKCNEVKVNEQELVILTMGWEGRGGNAYEQRVLPLKNALELQSILLDREVYFGEIWGKHSEVYGDMCKDTFEIERNENEVKKFLKSHPSGVDYNHSFIDTYTNRIMEYLDEDPDSLQEDENEELVDKIYSLLNY